MVREVFADIHIQPKIAPDFTRQYRRRKIKHKAISWFHSAVIGGSYPQIHCLYQSSTMQSRSSNVRHVTRICHSETRIFSTRRHRRPLLQGKPRIVGLVSTRYTVKMPNLGCEKLVGRKSPDWKGDGSLNQAPPPPLNKQTPIRESARPRYQKLIYVDECFVASQPAKQTHQLF